MNFPNNLCEFMVISLFVNRILSINCATTDVDVVEKIKKVENDFYDSWIKEEYKNGWKYIGKCGNEGFCRRYRQRTHPWLKKLTTVTTQEVTLVSRLKEKDAKWSKLNVKVICCQMVSKLNSRFDFMVLPLSPNHYCHLAQKACGENDEATYYVDECYYMATGWRGPVAALRKWLFGLSA